jgi:predicted transcriptional regulator of viral defense system
VSADQLFAVGLSADPAKLDPLEILTALEPDGVICYFSAIVLHGLSTQFPSHQHIATLVAREPRRGRSAERHASSGVPPLGSLRTTIEGIPYFSTERTASLVAGTQRRVISERLVIRCTTPAQTLLDCLHRPHSCGGPAVVFEAWEHAPRVSTPDALVSLARTIDHPDLSRRLGYMLESADAPEWQLPDELPNQLEVPSGQAPIPLFPAAGHQRVDARWGLLVP